MLFSTQMGYLTRKYGIEKAAEMLMDAGYPALDISMFDTKALPFTDDYKEVAKNLLSITNPKGVIFNQAHAPFYWKPDVYINELVPLFPRCFEFCSLLGVKNIVVHPRQIGRFYGREKEIFDENINFYKSIAPLSKEYGVKIAIENMWQTHPVAGYICDDICADPNELARMYDVLDDSDAFTVCLDLGHVALCGREPEDAIKVLGKDRLGALHVHDVDYKSDLHTLPGVSKIKWEKVCKALADIDYNGDITLEADNFFLGFFEEMYPTVTKFMADTARSLVEKITYFKNIKN